LDTSRVGPITIACDSALHMSYTASAAMLAPVSASISTPVRWMLRTAHSIRSALSVSHSIDTRQPSIGSGWQNGISSCVRFTAMVAAMIAVSTTGPFALRRPEARRLAATAAGKRTRDSATASRAVTGLADTSTIAGWPPASTWLSRFPI